MKLIILFISLLFTLLPMGTIQAQGICDFVPCDRGGCEGANCDALVSTTEVIRWGVSLIFVGIIIYGVFLIIRASLKIIRSEGDPTQVQEGSQSIRGVMVGLIVIFVGIIGIVIITVLFNAEGIFGLNQPNLPIINEPIL